MISFHYGTWLIPLSFLIALLYIPLIHSFSSNTLTTSFQQRRTKQWMMAFDTFVKVSSSYEAPCTLQADPGISLTQYMQLPVEQYVCIQMPLNATLERIQGNLFRLIVPPVRFFHLDVSPTLYCEVRQTMDTVEIISKKCLLTGSKYIESLNGCFNILVKTKFRWQDYDNRRMILSNSNIDVEVDPPVPFKFFGKRVLEATGNLAMSIALRQIENAFVKSLAKDYARWATDKAYRIQRANKFESYDQSIMGKSHEEVQVAMIADNEEIEGIEIGG